ncbi:MAG: ATP-binding cassette domain-containing protein [Ruminococcus sp.]|nr:ATP-binding cassette domain-containing protein [Ruminococcus sp.]
MPLEARNVYFRYGRKLPPVLENISFEVNRGEAVALSAPGGRGKTTLAMLLSGYLSPQRGQILLDGKLLPKKGVCPVQLIFQHPEKAVDPRWRMRRTLEESGGITDEILDGFGIERAWLDRFPRELSGGELQRFCVARAILSGADYLICDEMTAMLDPVTAAQIWNALLDIARSRSMGLVIITHDRPLAERTADRTVMLV